MPTGIISDSDDDEEQLTTKQKQLVNPWAPTKTTTWETPNESGKPTNTFSVKGPG
jgi:hypothetical protein